MKKVLLAGVIAGVMSSTAFAQGVDTDILTKDAAVTAGVGMSDVGGFEDSATVLTVGYEKGVASVPGVSVGVDYAMSVAPAETAGVEADYWTVGGYAKYSYDLGSVVPNLSANAKVGYSMGEAEVMGIDVDVDDVVIGAGVSYAVSDKASVTADYATFDEIDQVTVGVKYAF